MTDGNNIRVSTDVHKQVIEHLKNTEKKIGKWVEIAIIEKIKREKNDESIRADK